MRNIWNSHTSLHKHLSVIHVKVVKDTEQASHQINNQKHGLYSDSPEQLTQA